MIGRPPDLQDLVHAYGGYDHIPPAAWAKYDAAVAQWRANRRAQLHEETYQNQRPAKPKWRQLG